MRLTFTLLILLLGLSCGQDTPRSVTLNTISTIVQLHNASFDVSLGNNNNLIMTNGNFAYIMTRKYFDQAEWTNYNTYQLYTKDITNTQLTPNMIVNPFLIRLLLGRWTLS